MSRFDPFFERRRRSARSSALDRPELREPSALRQSAASPTSMAVKVLDHATQELIDEATRWREHDKHDPEHLAQVDRHRRIREAFS